MSKTLVIKGADYSENKLDTVILSDPVPCTGISIDKSTESITGIGSTATLTATVQPSDTTDPIVWGSSDNNVATVANGIITAVSVGNAVITATCGNYSATCLVSVMSSPNYAVIGAANPHRTTSSSTGAFVNVVGTATSSGYKFGGIGYVSNDESVKTVDRIGTLAGNYRLCPIQIPNGAKQIKIESKTALTFKTRFTWFDSTQAAGTSYSGAKVIEGLGSDSSWDQTDLASSVIVDIPTTTGIDSFCVALNVNDWSLYYNTDYKNDFDVIFLPEDNSN